MANYTRTGAAQAARDRRYAEALRLLQRKSGATREEVRKTLKTAGLNLDFVAKRLDVALVPVTDDRPRRYRVAA